MTAWIAALVLSVAITQQAPAPGTEPVHASEALVQEVRALRQAVEAVLATNVRVQLLMGRLQLQEARIQSLIQQNRDIDAQLGAITAQRDLFHQQLRMMERTSSETADPEEREFAKQQSTMIAERLKQIDLRYNSLLGEQANVQQLVAAEQNRWGEFNQRLEELERMLAARGR